MQGQPLVQRVLSRGGVRVRKVWKKAGPTSHPLSMLLLPWVLEGPPEGISSSQGNDHQELQGIIASSFLNSGLFLDNEQH
jgi:hypothetical protein